MFDGAHGLFVIYVYPITYFLTETNVPDYLPVPPSCCWLIVYPAAQVYADATLCDTFVYVLSVTEIPPLLDEII